MVEVVVGGIVAVEVAGGVDVGVAPAVPSNVAVGVALAVPSNVAVGEVSPAVEVSLLSGVDLGSPLAVSCSVGVGFPHKDGLEESCRLRLMLRPVSSEISSKMAGSTGKNERNGQGL